MILLDNYGQDYKKFLKLPEIESAFEEMFKEQKNYFKKKCAVLGFEREHLEAVSIKMAFVSTDFYFTEVHRNKLKK